ncbi:C2 domain-containing protein 3 isoform X3 [Echeneis naucrates]|uniref:C2 domain-containing protein 3 isoform X3 n=1 Tax=Echeneis naucrates TaxID=173247 RepID=UPI0011138B11|nr:C2 domain-containing protein 3 isoform X3 [Echeneis naucrates]
MKSRKQRVLKAGSSKKKVCSDVSPSTSLPPLVEGQLRCFLRLTINRILWTVHKPPAATLVRLRWWGESSNGTHFFPRDSSKLSQNVIKTTTRFAIRCGPKQFTSYLTDMGSLILELLTKSDHLPIARAQVTGISHLSMSHPISGFYTLVSPTSEKLGELQVSLSLEPLTEAYDSSSSGPVTDIGLEVPQPVRLTEQSKLRSPSAVSGKESFESSSGNTPRGKDHLYFQNAQKCSEGKEGSLENQMPAISRSQNCQTAVNPSNQEPCGQTTNDIFSVILERGNKLRDAMVVSALTCDMNFAPPLKDTPLPLPKDNIIPTSRPLPSPSAKFLQNILHSDSILEHCEDGAVVSDSGLDCVADMDNRAVDLLFGSLSTSPPVRNGDDFSPESLSGNSSVCDDSELSDPQYDQSLLENLFYKTPMPDTRPADSQAEEGTLSSDKKQPSQHLMCSVPKISKGPNSEHQRSPDAGDIPPGLSTEQLTLLSSIRVVRVTITSLTVPTGSTSLTPRNTSSKGKPPRPLTDKKCTYFVEYMLPMASTSSRHNHDKTGDGDVTRAVSSKVTEGEVKFLHHSVFPVHFNTETIKQWWRTDLIFKIYSRNSGQKKPVLIGKAFHPLCTLLEDKLLSQSVTLPVQSLEGNCGKPEAGPLVVSLELATNSKDFSSRKSKSKLAWRDTSLSQPATGPWGETSSRSQPVHSGRDRLPVHSLEDSRVNIWSPQKPSKEPTPPLGFLTSPHKSWQHTEEDPEVLLHTLLMVPDGRNFNCAPMQAPNVYLNCKLFWCDEMARSVVSWGKANPCFNFVQITPVALTTKLLERMKNNVMVIEVWQKTGSSAQDRILGLVKLPLHQFYMSFRDPKVSHLLLQAQYPVLGVDCYMPVIDVFSGSCKGNLRVVLAMGGSEQIVTLQRTRDGNYDSLSYQVKPVHLLDYQPNPHMKVVAQDEMMSEHLFMISVEKANGLIPLQSTVWGEADCYVQYTFPCQDVDTATAVDQNFIESTVNLKPFRTTTTLCVPDPVFDHNETHMLLVPEAVPVQRLLLSSLSSQGLNSGGGVKFEVWCRYYYPNVRDQLVARGLLPLSKLCALVTMHRQHPNEAQMFSLPLIPRTDSLTGHRPQPSGFLDVCIRYKNHPVRHESQTGRGAASRVVTLVVQVHRASGLQAAARLLAEQEERFSYFANVGVNTYVMVQLPFLPESERSTRISARTFCPEFDHHMEVSCDLLVQRSSGEVCSLAEQLDEASAVLTVWNRDNRKAMNVSKPKDVMLGTVKVPLADLIHKRTGISGWFGMYLPQETSSSQHQHVLVGGLEISIKFAHHSDRDRVIKAAQGLGWVMAQNGYEIQDDEAWEDSRKKLYLTFSMPRAWIPVHCLLLPGHSELQRSTYCYFRYKFYDQEAFCSQMKHPSLTEGETDSQATVSFEGSRTLELRRTQPLMWYLREERLEVQVWVAFKKDKARRPTDTDRLVGSAFIDLISLVKKHKEKPIVSGVYPLFRRSAADLQGAALRVHITLKSASVSSEATAGAYTQVDSDSQEELLSAEEKTTDRLPLPSTSMTCTPSRQRNKSSRTTPDITSVQEKEMSMDESFPVTVTVDQAMHLNLKTGCPLVERSEGTPCCCVSYVTADSAEPVSTAVMAHTHCPVWDHQHECRLPKQLLVDPQQSLVFKVWHKGEMERVLGFASVDLSPLLCGFQSVCGWYNITDFSGQCHGQLKVSVTPLKGVQDLRGQRKTANEESAKASPALPVSYHTTATYSSFPSHISRYPEQKISSPDNTDRMFSESDSDRHFEHMDKVRLYHQYLQEQTAAHTQSVCNSSASDLNPSSSFLFSALRKKLSELDNIQRYFSRKLSTPTFPSVTEHDYQDTKQEEDRESDRDTTQLLLKSNQLVGEANNIISGLRGHHLETIPSNSQSSTTSEVGDNNPQTIPESISCSRRASISSTEDMSTLPSPLPQMSEDHADSEAEEKNHRQKGKATESEEENEERTDEDQDGTDCRCDDGSKDDREEDEDYEEVVVKPRHLNEVTSLTDKTSPWTSILSDPDMVALESLEPAEEADLSQDEDKKRENLESCASVREHECTRQKERSSCDGSAGDTSNTEEGDETTLQASDRRQREEPHPSNKGSNDTSPSAMVQHTADTPDASLDSQDSEPQICVPAMVPNFFLPSHQLEASMRAIKLAPSFSQLSSDPMCLSSLQGHIPPVDSFPRRRAPPQRPTMSPSSMKKETERIAKIFAAHFDESN